MPFLMNAWQNINRSEMVKSILSNTGLWEQDLSKFPGFSEMVQRQLDLIEDKGAFQALIVNSQP